MDRESNNARATAATGSLDDILHAYVESPKMGARGVKNHLLKADFADISRCIFKYARTHKKEQKCVKIITLMNDLIAEKSRFRNGAAPEDISDVLQDYPTFEPNALTSGERSHKHLLYSTILYFKRFATPCGAVLDKIYDRGLAYVVKIIKNDLCSRRYTGILCRLAATLVLYFDVASCRRFLYSLRRSNKGHLRILFCRVVREIGKLARERSALYEPFFADELHLLLKSNITLVEACKALACLTSLERRESTYQLLKSKSRECRDIEIVSAMASFGALFSDDMLALLPGYEPSFEYFVMLDRLEPCPWLISHFERLVPAVFQVLDLLNQDTGTGQNTGSLCSIANVHKHMDGFRKNTPGFRKTVISLAVKMPSGLLTGYFRDHPDVLAPVYAALARGGKAFFEIPGPCGAQDVFFETLRDLIGRNDDHVISNLKELVYHMEEHRVKMILDDCIVKMKGRHGLGYYRAIHELVEYLGDRKAFSLGIIEQLHASGQANADDKNREDLALEVIVRILTKIYKTDRFETPEKLFVLCASFLPGSEDNAFLVSILDFMVLLSSIEVKIEFKGLVAVSYDLLRWLRSRNKSVSRAAVHLICKIAEWVGAVEVLGAVLLDDENKTTRNNVCVLVAALAERSAHVVLPLLVADYAEQDILVRHSVLKIISGVRNLYHINMVIPLVENSVTSSITSLRSMGLRACQNIIGQVADIETIHHILNLIWYFIMDPSVQDEINACISTVAERCGASFFLRHIPLGICHPCKRVRERYLGILRIIKAPAHCRDRIRSLR